MSTNQNSVVGLRLRTKVLDIGVTRNCAAHRLPIGNDHGGALDNRTRPTEFLRSADLNASGIERDPPSPYLFDGHAAVLWFPAVFVRQLDQVNEVSVKERDAAASRVNDLPAAEVLAIPIEEVEQRRDRKNGRSAFSPNGLCERLGWDFFNQRDTSVLEGFLDHRWSAVSRSRCDILLEKRHKDRATLRSLLVQ